MAKLITAFALLAEVQAQTNLTSSGETGTVYIIRHGEKDSEGCESSTGMKRANNMYDIFNAKFDVPEYVFAYTNEGSESWECQRCEQTAHPIAKRIGMSPDTAYGTNTCSNNWGPPTHYLIFADAIKDKLSDHDIVLVVADHQHILRIAFGLGASRSEIPEWSGNDYDTVFKMKFSNGKLDSFSVDKQGQFGPLPSPSPSPLPSPLPAPAPSGKDSLAAGERLASGDSLVSAQGNARLSVQGSDGNMVLHYGETVVWSSHTSGHPGAEMRFQGSDGNLVLYDGSSALWSFGNAPGAASVQLQDNCDLVTKDSSGKVLWSLGTRCRGDGVIV